MKAVLSLRQDMATINVRYNFISTTIRNAKIVPRRVDAFETGTSEQFFKF